MREAKGVVPAKWWGKHQLEEGEAGRWRVGSLDLWIRRTRLDWRYGWAHSDDSLEDTLDVEVPVKGPCEEDLPDERARFGFDRTDTTIELLPVLADRSVVARPAVPFFVPPGQTVELFVSTPLWITLRAGKSDLAEVPCSRPSDTWFGNNTRGKLCYATRTLLRRRLEELPLRPHRVVSCLSVENVSDSLLALERISLPMPQLTLFASPSGTLWTERVTVKKGADDDLSAVTLGKGAPRMAGGGKSVAAPRSPQGRSFGSLVFGGLFDSSY